MILELSNPISGMNLRSPDIKPAASVFAPTSLPSLLIDIQLIAPMTFALLSISSMNSNTFILCGMVTFKPLNFEILSLKKVVRSLV